MRSSFIRDSEGEVKTATRSSVAKWKSIVNIISLCHFFFTLDRLRVASESDGRTTPTGQDVSKVVYA